MLLHVGSESTFGRHLTGSSGARGTHIQSSCGPSPDVLCVWDPECGRSEPMEESRIASMDEPVSGLWKIVKSVERGILGDGSVFHTRCGGRGLMIAYLQIPDFEQ